MVTIWKIPSYLRHIDWYIFPAGQMPLCSDLDANLPLPDLKNVKVLWPDEYSWSCGRFRLDRIKKELGRLVPVQSYNVKASGFAWHKKGGFPVPDDKLSLIGTPKNPKGLNDIRGEIFEVHKGERVVHCALDYSDYPHLSKEILKCVDVYFKCIAPVGTLPAKVVSLGYLPGNTDQLSKARTQLFKNPPTKAFDVYGRFGTWTDSQPFRQTIVNNLLNSSVDFVGGFGKRIYPAYLKELMQTRIAVDAAGQAPISFRLVEGMALGALVICPKPDCTFPQEMIEGVHYVGIKEDGSNVVDVCHQALKDREKMRNIVRHAMVYFDHNFSPQSIGRRILRTALDATVSSVDDPAHPFFYKYRHPL